MTMTAIPAFAVEPAQHTVAWYRTHQEARETVLKTCQNDHTLDSAADCRNATSAAHGAVADSLGPAGKADREADPAFYGHNGPLIAMTLSMCARNAAPQAWCTAARTASANLPR